MPAPLADTGQAFRSAHDPAVGSWRSRLSGCEGSGRRTLPGAAAGAQSGCEKRSTATTSRPCQDAVLQRAALTPARLRGGSGKRVVLDHDASRAIPLQRGPRPSLSVRQQAALPNELHPHRPASGRHPGDQPSPTELVPAHSSLVGLDVAHHVSHQPPLTARRELHHVQTSAPDPRRPEIWRARERQWVRRREIAAAPGALRRCRAPASPCR